MEIELTVKIVVLATCFLAAALYLYLYR